MARKDNNQRTMDFVRVLAEEIERSATLPALLSS